MTGQATQRKANRDQAFRREARPGSLAGRKSLGEARQGCRHKDRTGRKAARDKVRHEGRHGQGDDMQAGRKGRVDARHACRPKEDEAGNKADATSGRQKRLKVT
jgi:hypothetical protein